MSFSCFLFDCPLKFSLTPRTILITRLVYFSIFINSIATMRWKIFTRNLCRCSRARIQSEFRLPWVVNCEFTTWKMGLKMLVYLEVNAQRCVATYNRRKILSFHLSKWYKLYSLDELENIRRVKNFLLFVDISQISVWGMLNRHQEYGMSPFTLPPAYSRKMFKASLICSLIIIVIVVLCKEFDRVQICERKKFGENFSFATQKSQVLISISCKNGERNFYISFFSFSSSGSTVLFKVYFTQL